jgi:hypothetical protein
MKLKEKCILHLFLPFISDFQFSLCSKKTSPYSNNYNNNNCITLCISYSFQFQNLLQKLKNSRNQKFFRNLSDFLTRSFQIVLNSVIRLQGDVLQRLWASSYNKKSIKEPKPPNNPHQKDSVQSVQKVFVSSQFQRNSHL